MKEERKREIQGRKKSSEGERTKSEHVEGKQPRG